MKSLLVLVALVFVASAQRAVTHSRANANLQAFQNSCYGFNGQVKPVCDWTENAAMTEGGYSCCVVVNNQPTAPAVKEVPKAPKGDYTNHCTSNGGAVVDGKTCPSGQEMVFKPVKVAWGLLGYDVCCRPAVDVYAFTGTCDGFRGRVVQSPEVCNSNENAAMSEGNYNCCVQRFSLAKFTRSCDQQQGYVSTQGCQTVETVPLTESGYSCCVRPAYEPTTSTVYSEAGNNGRNGKAAVRNVIRKIQTALSIKVDGVYGPETTRAVRRFQQQNRLAVDGQAGPETIQALKDQNLWPLPEQQQQPQVQPQKQDDWFQQQSQEGTMWA